MFSHIYFGLVLCYTAKRRAMLKLYFCLLYTSSVNLITDRSITLSFALILPDEAFLYHTQGMYEMCIRDSFRAT